MRKLTKNSTFSAMEIARAVGEILAADKDTEILTQDFVKAVVAASGTKEATATITKLSASKDAAFLQIQAKVQNSGNYLAQFMANLSGDSISPMHRANIVASLADTEGKFDQITIYANRTLKSRRDAAKAKAAEKVPASVK